MATPRYRGPLTAEPERIAVLADIVAEAAARTQAINDAVFSTPLGAVLVADGGTLMVNRMNEIITDATSDTVTVDGQVRDAAVIAMPEGVDDMALIGIVMRGANVAQLTGGGGVDGEVNAVVVDPNVGVLLTRSDALGYWRSSE